MRNQVDTAIELFQTKWELKWSITSFEPVYMKFCIHSSNTYYSMREAICEVHECFNNLFPSFCCFEVFTWLAITFFNAFNSKAKGCCWWYSFPPYHVPVNISNNISWLHMYTTAKIDWHKRLLLTYYDVTRGFCTMLTSLANPQG